MDPESGESGLLRRFRCNRVAQCDVLLPRPSTREAGSSRDLSKNHIRTGAICLLKVDLFHCPRAQFCNYLRLSLPHCLYGLAQGAPLVLSNAGTGGFGGVPGNATGGPELRDDDDALATDPVITAAPAASGAASVSSAPASILGAAGLNHHDNRTADGGNNFSVEPPDQGLCPATGTCSRQSIS